MVNDMSGASLVELYLMYEEVEALLGAAGIRVAHSLVGSYVTSLDVTGCSVIVLKADDELLALWDASIRTTGLRWEL